jgi:hypothetical protein
MEQSTTIKDGDSEEKKNWKFLIFLLNLEILEIFWKFLIFKFHEIF